MGKIFLIIGPSSSGKDTIYRKVKELYEDFKPIILYTNRPIRENETNGIDYNFVSLDEINRMSDDSEILEKRVYQTEYGPWVYATAKTNIDLENNNYICINTIDGYISLYEYYKDDIVPFYIHVDDGIRLTRALEREKKEENPRYTEMCRRFIGDSKDFTEEKINRYFKDNIYSNDSNDVNICVNEIVDRINKELDMQKQKKKNFN